MPEEINDNTKMAFGKFRDYPLVSVPASYLLFLYDNERAGRYAPYIKENMNLLIKQAKKETKR
jgi:uncharacterized protein (DUF3820 family)